jgi:ketosteroid isomerase-like protein
MRILVLIASFLLAGIVICANAEQSSDESQILQLEEDWVQALKAEDREGLNRILAPDFTFIEGDGSVLSRDAYLADRGKNPYDITSFEASDMKVRVFGNAALVTGLSRVEEHGFGKNYRYALRWKEMWLKTGGQWQVLAGQATPVNAKWNAPFVVP